MSYFIPFLGKQDLYPDQELKQYQDGISYLKNQNSGYQLEFQFKKLKNVYLYGNHDKEFKKYEGQLPYGLDFTMCNAHVVSKFGEPTGKQGGGPMNIGISYDHLGLEVTFQTKQWDQPNVVIDQIILYEQKIETYCGMCKKKGDLRCSQCKLVYYCGQECQKQHWKTHKQFCK